MPEIACVNGDYLPLERAVVHVEDRGFQFADSVYEVVRTYHGQPFAVDEHVERLMRSLDGIRLRHRFTADRLKSLIAETVRRAGFAETVAYVQVTRGHAPRHRGFPTETEPTLVITARALEPSSRTRETGVSVITVPDNRWARCDIKSVALLANVLAYDAAKEQGAHDAVFIEPDGTVNEATAGNIFVARDGKLATPPKGPKILAGVTRDKILKAAHAAGIKTEERAVMKSELYVADEIFLTSTTAEVVPVVAVDGKFIGTGKPGPISAHVYEQFMAMFVQK